MGIDGRKVAMVPLKDRIQARSFDAPNGCVEWTGSVTEHGYGRMSYRNRVERVHRLVAHLHLGLDLNDPRVKVLHKCDNPPCVNPDHLYLGNQKENVRDMVERGRNYGGPSKWTHCKNGHELTPENRIARRGRCLTCAVAMQRERRRKNAVQAIQAALAANNEKGKK